MTVAQRYAGVIDWFEHNMPEPRTELHYQSPFQLLVAVILSAQCTDKRINMVTPPLFEAFPTPQALAAASEEEVFELIRSVSDIDSLLTIPGVGRKTANVILSVVFDKAAMAVDTHVFRVSERIGLTTRSKNPLQTERTLMKYIPEQLVGRAHHWLILHGRYVCKARRPDCLNCGLQPYCRYWNREQK